MNKWQSILQDVLIVLSVIFFVLMIKNTYIIVFFVMLFFVQWFAKQREINHFGILLFFSAYAVKNAQRNRRS